MNYEKYICITCGNISQVIQNSAKPQFCPVCKNTILQKVSSESNPAYRFMVPWDISQYNPKEERKTGVNKRHSEFSVNHINEISYF